MNGHKSNCKSLRGPHSPGIIPGTITFLTISVQPDENQILHNMTADSRQQTLPLGQVDCLTCIVSAVCCHNKRTDSDSHLVGLILSDM